MYVLIMKCFSIKDQLLFSTLSGDNNPIHLDAIYARRTVWGKPVVHGVHIVLRAINEWLSSTQLKSCELTDISVEFLNVLLIDEEPNEIIKDNGKEVSIQIMNSYGNLITKILFNYVIKSKNKVFNFNSKISKDDVIEHSIAAFTTLSETITIPLCINFSLLKKMYPDSFSILNLGQISLLLNTTRCVGNRWPGLNSIYHKLDIKFTNKRILNSKVLYTIKKVHTKLNFIDIECQCDIGFGSIRAFVRPSFSQQASVRELASKVSYNEFHNQKALVIGGSRGIGEVVVKLIALGGAEVLFTFVKGTEDANRVIESLNDVNINIETQQYDTLMPTQESIEKIIHFQPTHIYYFATPAISQGKKNTFTIKLLYNFIEYYLNSFIKLLELFSYPTTLFYPSSVFVEELTDGMWEYSISKYAGELLCMYINKYRHRTSVFSPRLPRIVTDQTVSLLPIKTKKAEDVMLPLLRQFHLKDF